MTTLSHEIRISAPRDRVYEAVSTHDGLTGWFTADVENAVGEGKEALFKFTGHEPFRWRFAELSPDSRVCWECTRVRAGRRPTVRKAMETGCAVRMEKESTLKETQMLNTSIAVAAAAMVTLVHGAQDSDRAYSSEAFRYSKVANQITDVGPVRYAYRKVGEDNGVPLILLMHTRGNMDNWDPALVDELSKQRLVVAFDNKGVGLTNGDAPSSFEEMADDAAAFINALGYRNVDILGFSIGGAVGQELILRHPGLVRKAILAGTSGKGGEGVNTMSERSKSVSTKNEFTDDDLLYDFFAPSPTSQARGRQFLTRIKARKTDLDAPVSMKSVKAQAIAREEWGKPHEGYDDLMQKVAIPVLIANGKDDIRMPSVNSYHLFNTLPKAQLNLYPDSGHGFLFQYPKSCAENFNSFLNQDDF